MIASLLVPGVKIVSELLAVDNRFMWPLSGAWRSRDRSSIEKLRQHGRRGCRLPEGEIDLMSWLIFAAIGILGGLVAGLFGVGGGIVIVPALIYWAGFSQHRATGTSIAVLLPPIGLAAALEYYRHGNVDVRAAIILATTVFLGAWVGAYAANQIQGPYLRLSFGVFVCALGVYLIYGACKRLGWL